MTVTFETKYLHLYMCSNSIEEKKKKSFYICCRWTELIIDYYDTSIMQYYNYQFRITFAFAGNAYETSYGHLRRDCLLVLQRAARG